MVAIPIADDVERNELLPKQGFKGIEKLSALNGVMLMIVSMLGSGLVCAPFAFAQAGPAGTTGCLLFSCFMCWYSCVQLAKATDLAQEPSYEGVVAVAMKNKFIAMIFSDIPITLFGFAVGAVYIIITKNLIYGAFAMIEATQLPNTLRICMVAAFMFSVSLLRSYERFKNINVLCFGMIMTAVVMIVIRANNMEPLPVHEVKTTLSGILTGFPLVVTAFHCHVNIPGIYAELKPEVKKSYPFVAMTAMIVCCVLTWFTGYIPYTKFLSATEGDILRQLCEVGGFSWLLVVAQICLGLALIFKSPFLISPLKSTMLGYFGIPVIQSSNIENFASTGFVVGTAMSISLVTDNLGTLSQYVGSTCIITICFISPGIALLKLTKNQSDKVKGVVLAIFGLLAGVFATTLVTIDLMNAAA